MEEKRERIKIWMGACIILVALFIDLFETLTTWLGIGIVFSPIISVCATVLFWIWYKILYVPFIASPKKFATLAITSFVEIIPGLDAIPLLSFGWTIGAIIMVIMVRAEDSGGMLGTLAGTSMGMMKQRYSARPDLYRNTETAMQNKDILAFKQGDIENEALRRNPQFSKEQYQKGIGMAGDVVTKNTNSLSRRQFLGLNKAKN